MFLLQTIFSTNEKRFLFTLESVTLHKHQNVISASVFIFFNILVSPPSNLQTKCIVNYVPYGMKGRSLGGCSRKCFSPDITQYKFS